MEDACRCMGSRVHSSKCETSEKNTRDWYKAWSGGGCIRHLAGLTVQKVNFNVELQVWNDSLVQHRASNLPWMHSHELVLRMNLTVNEINWVKMGQQARDAHDIFPCACLIFISLCDGFLLWILIQKSQQRYYVSRPQGLGIPEAPSRRETTYQ